MRLRLVICLIAMLAVAPGGRAEPKGDAAGRSGERESALDLARSGNKVLRELVDELTKMNKKHRDDLAVRELVIERLEKDRRKLAAGRRADAEEYKLALAENKMLRARIKSLLRPGASSTTKPKGRSNTRVISITLHENFWKWWSDPILLSEHIALRRKLTTLDVDHSIDAWLTRRKEFHGTRVNWSMKLVSGTYISKEKVNKAWKKAKQDLNDTLNAAVYGVRRPAKTDNPKVAASRPGAKKSPPPKKAKPPLRIDFRKRIRELQEQIEMYKRASAAGGMTTIYAVAGDIAIKMSLPGRRLTNVSLNKRPDVQITADIVSAAPKAGLFIGRKDTMLQFVVTGECKLKDPDAAKRDPK